MAAPTETFALAATLVADAAISPSLVDIVTSAVLATLPQFRERHPAFGEFDESEMAERGRVAPLHLGAARGFLRAARPDG